MPINRIYPHYPKPKPNPTPPLKRRDQNSPFATIASLKNDTALGPPTKKLAVIETEPILTNDFYETAGLRNINPLPKPRTNENAWSLVTQMKFTYWGHSSVDTTGDYYDVLKLDKKSAYCVDDSPL
jgi:hypothetical protein